MQLDALNAVVSGVRTILNSLGMERPVHCTKWLSIGYSILYCQWHHYLHAVAAVIILVPLPLDGTRHTVTFYFMLTLFEQSQTPNGY